MDNVGLPKDTVLKFKIQDASSSMLRLASWNYKPMSSSCTYKSYDRFVTELKISRNISEDKDIRIIYVDDENEEIPIECNEELMEACRVGMKCRELKLIIAKKEKTKETNKTLAPHKIGKSIMCFSQCYDFDATNSRPERAMVDKSTEYNKYLSTKRKDLGNLTKRKVCSDSNSSLSTRVIGLKEASDKGFLKPMEIKRGNSVDSIMSVTDTGSQPIISDGNQTESLVELRKEVKALRSLIEYTINKLTKFDNINFEKFTSEHTSQFEVYLAQFKRDLLSDLNRLLDEKLGSVPDVQPSRPSTSFDISAHNLSANATVKDKKIMNRLEVLCEKEKRLDKRLEKMESKKFKILGKMNNRAAKFDTNSAQQHFLNGYFNANVFEYPMVKITPGEKVSVTLNLVNKTFFKWDDKTKLKQVTVYSGLETPKYVSCPHLKNGASGEVTIPVKAHDVEALFQVVYIIYHAGKCYGPYIEMTVMVSKSNSNEVRQKIVKKNETVIKKLVIDDTEEDLSETVKNLQIKCEDASGPSFVSPKNGNDIVEGSVANSTENKDVLPKEVDGPIEAILDDSDEESSSDEFVVIPMPPCFLPDCPADAVDPVPTKVLKKIIQSKEENDVKIVHNSKRHKVIDNGKTDEASGPITMLPDEPYQSIDRSVYMVDKFGKCFLVDDANNSDERNGQDQLKHSSKKVKVPYLIREKEKRIVYVGSKDHELYKLPEKISEKIYLNDPEYARTSYVVCDGLKIVSDGSVTPFWYSESQQHCQMLSSPPRFDENFDIHRSCSNTCVPNVSYYNNSKTIKEPVITNRLNTSSNCPPPPPSPIFPKVDDYACTACVPQSKNIPQQSRQGSFKPHNYSYMTGGYHKRPLNPLNNFKYSVEMKKCDHPTKIITVEKEKKKVAKKLYRLDDGHGKYINLAKLKKRKESEKTLNDRKKQLGHFVVIQDLIADCSARPNTDITVAAGESATTGETQPVVENNADENCALNATTDAGTSNSDRPIKQGEPVQILPEGLMNTLFSAYSVYSKAMGALYNLRQGVDEEVENVSEDDMMKLALLVEMGFLNTEKNKRLLKKYNSNISEVVENYYTVDN